MRFWVVGDFMFEMVYSASNAEASDLQWRWIRVCYFELVLFRRISQLSNRNIEVSYLIIPIFYFNP